jgi:hypothetical protein
MKRTLGLLLALALITGAGLAQAGRGGGAGHGGGGARAGGGHFVAARPTMSGGFTRFTTGPMQFTTASRPWRPIVGGHPPGIVRPVPLPPRPIQPIQPIHSHPVVVGGGIVIVSAPWYPYPYPYPYPYVTPAYGGSAYMGAPTYSDASNYSDAPAYSYSEGQGNSDVSGYTERSDYWYFCPDSQTYYPYVSTCPSPWVQVLPEPSGGANN